MNPSVDEVALLVFAGYRGRGRPDWQTICPRIEAVTAVEGGPTLTTQRDFIRRFDVRRWIEMTDAGATDGELLSSIESGSLFMSPQQTQVLVALARSRPRFPPIVR